MPLRRIVLGIFFCLSFCIVLTSYSQSRNKILIYTNKNDFLVPYIQETLEGMNNQTNQKKIFTQVTNLNLLFINTQADTLLRNIFRYENFLPQKDKELEDSITDLFLNNDLFLLVNENVLLDKIEFQLTLYNIISSSDSSRGTVKPFPLKNLLRIVASSDFFISTTSPDYLIDLKKGVKKLIKESNYPTVFSATLTGNVYELPNNHFVAATEDTLTIDIDNIEDEDSQIDLIKFKVIVFSDSKSVTKPYEISETNLYQYRIKFRKKGLYKVITVADDGVITTPNDTMFIDVKDIPKVQSSTSKITIPYSDGIFGTAPYLKFKLYFSIFNNNSNDSTPLIKFDKDTIRSKKDVFYSSNFFYRGNSMNNRPYIFNKKNKLYSKKIGISKIDSNGYSMSIEGQPLNFSNKMLLYGTTQHIKTNQEKIELDLIGESLSSFKPGFKLSQIYIDYYPTDSTSGIHDSSAKIGILEYSLLSLDYRLVSLSPSSSIGFHLAASSPLKSTQLINHISTDNKILTLSTTFGIMYFKQSVTKSYFYDFNFGVIYRNINLNYSADPKFYNNYGALYGYNTYGAHINLDVSPLKWRTIGTYISGDIYSGKENENHLTGYSLNIGLMYHFIYHYYNWY